MKAAALIFDLDGTLAETEEIHRAAFNAAFAAAGLPWRWGREDYRRLLTTTGGRERILRHIREIGAEAAGVDVHALHADKTRRYAARLAAGGLVLRPGVADLIGAARAAGRPVAVATTTSRPNVEALALACFGQPATAVFDAIAAGDEVATKKPAPDLHLLALDRLGLPAGDCLAFEDSANGLAAARAAGLPCLVAPGPYTAHEALDGAVRVVAEWSEVDAAEL